MTAAIDMSNGRANMAFVGSRGDIWHGLGHEIQVGESIDSAVTKAGLGFQVIKRPLWVDLQGMNLVGTDGKPLRGIKIEDKCALTRGDTGTALGIVSSGARYNIVQPRTAVEFLYQFISADPRYRIDTLGSLEGGAKIWAMVSFCDEMSVAGERHQCRVLITTSYDGTMATIASATTVRVVCLNTIRASLAQSAREKSEVRVRHSTRFDAVAAAKQLAQIAQGFAAYKAMGDAMAAIVMSKEETSNFFKSILDIPWNAAKDDISTRKLNQFDALKDAYSTTLQEGAKPLTQWSALQAVTRYVDHTKSTATRAGSSAAEARVQSAEFGSGAQMKAKAVRLLLGTNGETIEEEFDADVTPPSAPPARGNGLLSQVLDAMDAGV